MFLLNNCIDLLLHLWIQTDKVLDASEEMTAIRTSFVFAISNDGNIPVCLVSDYRLFGVLIICSCTLHRFR